MSLNRGGSSRLHGHILRSADDSPAALALKFAVTISTQCRGRVGAHRKNLFKTIENDLALRGFKNFKSNSLEKLNKLKILACDRFAWRDKFNSLAV